MYNIYFYEDSKGKKPVKEFILELAKKNDKNSRIQLNKIQEYIQNLSVYGFQLKEPHIKHLDGDIWELRPVRNRIMFAAWNNNGFVLLHHFFKTTQKTPKTEIEKAKQELAEFKEGG